MITISEYFPFVNMRSHLESFCIDTLTPQKTRLSPGFLNEVIHLCCNSVPMTHGDTPFKLKRAVKESSLSLQEVCDRMKTDYDVDLTASELSH